MRKRTQRVLCMAMFLAFLLAGPSLAGAGAFEEILDYVQKMHISSPQTEALYDGAINGLIDTLDDPYTVYMRPDELEEFSNSLQGTFVGVGIELVPGESYPGVLGTIEGSPAESAGVKAGDILLKVDGNDIAKESLPNIIQKIRGQEGTRVRLTIQRAERGDFDVELLRSAINLPSVQEELLDGGIGYIKINIFGGSTAGDFKDSLNILKNKGAEKLILDLRGDPGGYLQAAVQIAGNFVDKGRVVVSIVDRYNNRQSYYTEGTPNAKDMQLAILVNDGSASASEILAGALQDFGVATLIGERTYGKGTVQTVIPLEAGGALKLTTAKYYTPKDRVIDHMGLGPDVQVLTSALQLEAAKSLLNPPDKITASFKDGETGAIVNGSAVELFQAPLQQGDISYLPLRFLFEALGYRVDWQPSDGSIKVTDTNTEVLFYPGEYGQVSSCGQKVTGTDPLLNENEETYVPLSSLKLFNLKVEVDNGRITIEK